MADIGARLDFLSQIDAEGEDLPNDVAAMRLASVVVAEMTRNQPGWAPALSAYTINWGT